MDLLETRSSGSHSESTEVKAGAAARHEAKRTTVDMTWTATEDKILSDLYPDYGAMAEVLRHRSYCALRGRTKALGIQKRRHVWTNKEVERLRLVWSKDTASIKAMFPGVPYTILKQKGKSLGLPRRGVPPFVLTGDPCCDAIRDRCRELGYSMVQLDEMARTRTYFQKATWRGHNQHRLGPMLKAINALGGTFRVDFPD